MACVFLVGYGEAEKRYATNQRCGEAKRRRRVRQDIPDWFTDRLCEADYDVSPPVPNYTSMLVTIRCGLQFEGALTRWDREEWFLWHSQGCQQDAQSWRIHRGVHVLNPVRVSGEYKQSTMNFRELVSPPVDVNMISGAAASRTWRLGEQSEVMASPRIKAYLEASHEMWRSVGLCVPYVWVPLRILHLIGQARWRSLLTYASHEVKLAGAAARSIRALANWPSSEWQQRARRLAKSKLQPQLQQQGHVFSARSAEALAHSLRSWTPVILEGLSQDDPAETMLEIEHFVPQLRTLSLPHLMGHQ